MSASEVARLVAPLTFEEFRDDFYLQETFAAPGTALLYRKLVGWPLLSEIFESGYDDCWLAKDGRLATEGSDGHLRFEQAYRAFGEGTSIVVRQSQRAHRVLKEIATAFEKVFGDPIDIQLYATPAGQEGFSWHFDIEEVFVLQSSGEKEFFLRVPNVLPSLSKVELPSSLDFTAAAYGDEIRCHLKPGDFLYIPAGVWHKAKALTPSFHLSIGVMAKERFR